MMKQRICFLCGKQISESESVPVYKEVLDSETGGLKRVIDYFLCKSCNAKIKRAKNGDGLG
jgi:uncharacterized protein YlaN (UPF0358 family)